MNGNKLKILACFCMFIDHLGYILFPSVLLLRYVGRLALPIFSFLIAEGSLHTKNKTKYFFSVFGLAVLCQSAFMLEALFTKKDLSFYFNILFTFSFSILLCYAFLGLKNAVNNKQKEKALKCGAVFIIILALSIFIIEILPSLVNKELYFDYGIAGALLPIFALIFKDKRLRLISFFIGITLLNLLTYKILNYTWLSYLALLPLSFYNGKRGKRSLKYFFYAFYPTHLAILYLIKFII